MKIRQLLLAARESLQSISSTPQLEAELLLLDLLRIDRTQLMLKMQDELLSSQELSFWSLVDRRKQGEPIAYILGHKEFWSLELKVTKDVLIPRPETELLVERVLTHFPANDQPVGPIKLIDLGTGSGAIALAIASERPSWHILATDQSSAALSIAEENAKQLGIQNIEFRLGNWLEVVSDEQVNIIVSNPPYIAETDPHLLQADLKHEPQTALISGADGLKDLREIISQAGSFLLPQGWLLVEHGYNQGAVVQQLFKRHGFRNVKDWPDLSGLSRVTEGQVC